MLLAELGDEPDGCQSLDAADFVASITGFAVHDGHEVQERLEGVGLAFQDERSRGDPGRSDQTKSDDRCCEWSCVHVGMVTLQALSGTG